MERARVRVGSATVDLRLASVLGGLCLVFLSGLAHAAAPAAPTGLQAGAGDGQVHLWWSSNTESDLMDYRIWYATFTGSLGTKAYAYTVLAELTTKVDIAGIANGTPYYYQITARNLSSQESGGGVEVSTTPHSLDDNVAPSTGAGLGAAYAASQPPTTLNLSWIANTETDRKDYRILRSSFSGASTTKRTLATVADPGTTHQDAGLVQQTTYYYQFIARDIALNASAASTEASAWPGDQIAPATPAGLGVVNAGPGNILTLSWTANTETDLKDYAVNRATFSGAVVGAAFQAARVVMPGTTHQDGALTDGTTYYYRLTARDTSLNTSSASAEASAFPSDTIGPAAITNLTAATQAQIILTWTAPAEDATWAGGAASSYQVRYSTTGPISTLADWTSGVGAAASPPIPSAPGTSQTMVITGLKPRIAHWFAIRSQDAAGNLSGMQVTTPNASAGSFVLAQEPAGIGTGVAWGPGAGAAWGDYDNDGDLDLAVNGYDGALRRFRVYRNDAGIFNLVQEPAGATGPGSGSVTWGDYDNDGDLDLAVTGLDGTGYRFRVYRNDAGTFNLVQEPAGAMGPEAGVAWGDYDNDGDLDLAVNGYDGVSYRFRVYRNDAGTFNLVQEPAGATGPGDAGSLAWGDYDNDGDLDLAVVGSDGTGYRFRIYRNDGGTFNLAQEPAGATGPGTGGRIAWGDYDNDGDVDLVVTGYDGLGYRFRVYRNDAGTLNMVQEPMGAAAVAYGAVAWGDFDNDGDLDLAVTGLDGTGYRFRVYRNDAGTFNLVQEPAGIAGPGNGAIAWSDFDNDGDLDLAVTGLDGTGYRFRIYKSLEADFYGANTAPAAPVAGFATSKDTAAVAVTLKWNAGSDSGTGPTPANGLYYIARVSTQSGVYTSSPSLKVSWLPATPFIGNYPHGYVSSSAAQLGLNLKPGGVATTFYWQVASVDAGLKQSAWSVEQSTFVDLQPPTVPTGTGAADVAGDQGFALRVSWNQNTEGDLKDYGVYRTTWAGASPAPTQRITYITAPGTTHQDGGLTNGASYYYRLTARDTNLNESVGATDVNAYPSDNLAPAGPTGLGVADVAGDQGTALSLSWAGNTEADLKDYTIRRATYSGAGASPAPTRVTSPGTTHQDSGLAFNVTYYYTLAARDVSLNESGLSTEMSAFPVDNLAPTAPTGIIIAASSASVNVSWNANTETDLKDYRVHRSTNAGVVIGSTWTVTVATASAPSSDAGLTNGATYYYRISARDQSFNESGLSIEVSTVPSAGADTAPPSVPGSPGAVDVPSDQGGAINLSWAASTDNIAVKDYGVYRATWAGASPAPTPTRIAGPGTTHQATGLNNGATYYFRFTARDTSLNESGYSTEVSAIPYDNLAPATPTGLGAADVSGDQGFALRLNWTANTESDLKDYGVFRATWAGASPAPTPTRIQQPGTTNQDTGLTNGTTFYYRLTARDVSLNESGYSTEVSAIPYDNLAPATPGGVGVTDVPGDQGFALRLSWTANTESDQKDYAVYRATWAGASPAPTPTRIQQPGTTHQDAGLTNATTFYYRLTARDVSLNESGYSTEASAIPYDNLGPPTPTGLGINNPGGGGSLRLSWTGNTEADLKDYGVYQATWAGASPAPTPARIAAPGTTHQAVGLTNGATYYFRLTARDVSLNESGFSAEVSAATGDLTPPAAPVGLGVSNSAAGANTGGLLSLSWTANTEPDFKDYGVYRATYTGAPVAPPANVTRIVTPGTTHQDGGLTNGATFYYRLTARDASTNESGGGTESSVYPLDTVAPSAPTGLIAAAEAVGGLLDISWGPVTDTDLKDYRVWRATYSPVGIGGAFSPATVIVLPGTTQQDRGLTNETTYYYRVTARDMSLNESGTSNESGKLPRDSAPPSAPTGLTVTDPGNVSKLELTWKANTDVDFKEYRVYRTTWAGASPAPTQTVATISAGNQTLTDTGLVTSATYYYRLTARDFTGNESAGSSEVTGMPSRSVSDVTIAQPDATTTLVVTPPTGEIRVELPPGTFPDPTSVSVMVATGSLPTDANPPPGVALRTLPIAISITAGTRLQPARPVLLSVSYRDQDLPQDAKAERLKIARYDDNRRRWIVLDDSAVNTAKRQVKATTTHFSLFALVELVPASDLSKVVIYPNPWQPGSKGAYDRAAVIVSGLVPQARVRIYTLTGRFIRELAPADASGTTLWDGANDSGEMVASGTYFVLADAPGQSVVRKRVAVER